MEKIYEYKLKIKNYKEQIKKLNMDNLFLLEKNILLSTSLDKELIHNFEIRKAFNKLNEEHQNLQINCTKQKLKLNNNNE